MRRDKLTKGLIQIYTGDSKGKSTAAFGLVARAIGHGFQAYIVQFMKGSNYYGETITWNRLYPQIQYSQYGRACPHGAEIRQGEGLCRGCGECFIKPGQVTDADREMGKRALNKAKDVIQSGQFDIVVLDEILNALWYDTISLDEVISLLDNKPEQVEVIMTGRNASAELIEKADLVTEMKSIKHPFEQGIAARRGIEY